MARRQSSSLGHRLIASVVALALGLAIGFAAMGYAPVLAGMCPGCFGFRAVAPGVYSELTGPTTSDEMLRRLDIAEQRVAEAFDLAPDELPRPRILICYTPTCERHMGVNGPRAMAYGSHLFYLTPRGHETEIMAHELAHIVLHKQLGLRAQARFPAWVDEGIAVWASKDPRFDLDPRQCDPGEAELPERSELWRHAEGGSHAALYGSAGCRVSRWLHRHPVSGLDGLIAQYSGDSDG